MVNQLLSQTYYPEEKNYEIRSWLIFITLFLFVLIAVILSIFHGNFAGDKGGRLSEKSELAIYTTLDGGFPKAEAKFLPWKSGEAVPVNSAEHIWIRIRFDNRCSTDYRAILEIERRWLNEAFLYTKTQESSYQQLRTGVAVPLSERAVASHLLAFPIRVRPDSKKEYFLHLSGIKVLSGAILDLWEDELAFWAQSNKEQYFFSIYVGTLCALSTFLFIAFYVIRQKDLYYYTGYVLATGYCLLIIFNMQSCIPLLDQMNGVTLSKFYYPAQTAAIVLFIFFALEFLQTKNNLPRIDQLLRYSIIVSLIIIFIVYIFNWKIKTQVTLYLSVILVSSSLLVALYRLKQGYRRAAYFILAYCVILLMGLNAFWSSVATYEEPSSGDLRHLLQGFNIEIIVLAVALGERFLGLRHYQLIARKEAFEKEKNKVNLQKRYQRELKAVVLKRSKELNEINDQKDRLFAVLSHDLRTPVNNMAAIADVMLNDPSAFSKEALSSYAGEIQSTGKQLLELLENLLQWAQVQTNELILNNKNHKLCDMLQTSLKIYTKYACKSGICLNVHIKPDIEVLADSQIINAVIRNLLSNAIKHTPTGGEVILSADKENNNVYVKVSDTGVGLSAEEVRKINSGNALDSKEGLEDTMSSGFGLKLCQKLLEIQDTKLKVYSKKTKGSIFFFKLRKVF